MSFTTSSVIWTISIEFHLLFLLVMLMLFVNHNKLQQYIDDKARGVTGIDNVISHEITGDVIDSLLVQPDKKQYTLQVETADDTTFINVI